MFQFRKLNTTAGLEGIRQPKVPTIISYDPHDKESFTWGAQTHKFPTIEGIKLLLDPDQEQPVYVPATNTKAELRKLGKPAVDVVADFLRAMYQHALKQIEGGTTAKYATLWQKIFVLSVPAAWSDKAKDLTQRVGTASTHKGHKLRNLGCETSWHLAGPDDQRA